MPPLKKKTYVLLAAVLLILAGLYIANSGGLPVTSLNASNIGEFTRSFDSDPAEIRLVLLVSPT